MNRGLAAGALLLLCIAQACAIRAAWAASIDPPRYDSNIFCRLRANTPEGFSDDAQSQCLARQRMAYQAIRQEWNELPEEIREGCDEYTRLKDPLDYEALYSCIQMQQRYLPLAPDVDDDPPTQSASPSEPRLPKDQDMQ
ncbi:MAG TPA: hypothetical protein VGC69_14030 [Bordetella sp.]